MVQSNPVGQRPASLAAARRMRTSRNFLIIERHHSTEWHMTAERPEQE
jgi:hypothetical protein